MRRHIVFARATCPGKSILIYYIFYKSANNSHFELFADFIFIIDKMRKQL